VNELISLGIESSAYAFGIGIVRGSGEILANEKAIYKPTSGKGLIPHEAAVFHKKNAEIVLNNALEKAKLSLDKIDVISYTAGAGIPLCLLVGAELAIKISKNYKKPLVKVCHQIGHLEIGKLTTGVKDPIFVYTSGGNSQIIVFTEGRYIVAGETEDIALGNCFDVVAREMGLDMPGGPKIDELALKGKYIDLPYTVKGCDLSFSGITTAAINLLKKDIPKEDVAYSLQETCFSMLTEVTERIMAHSNKEEVLLVGGVAASKKLQEMIKIMCNERGANMYVVPKEYAGDNGSMIGWTGILAYKSGWKPDFKDKIRPKWRIDEVDIPWLKQ